jgi:branched-chain amino acid transport system ATP-binding protein
MLNITNLSVAYGPVRALRHVTLHVAAGEIVTLLGANGAGKTSLLRAISGLTPVTHGTIRLEGVELTRLPPAQIVRHGLAHCPEGRRIFPGLTVAENLDLGAYCRPADPAERRANLDCAFQYFPVLAERRQQKAGTLSGGEQQMLALGRALMSSPRIILLDEPSLGLAPRMVDMLFDIIRQINRERRTTVLLVEQNANEALLHADRGYVLENGQITLSGTAAELRDNPRVRDAYLGV